METIALCADSLSLRYPELMGLEGESVQDLPWLMTFSTGPAIRSYLRGRDEPAEVWVNSADDMEAINVAAALKRDRPRSSVVLAGLTVSGSAASRAQAAGIDATLSREAFLQRFLEEKRRRRLGDFPTAKMAPIGPKAPAPAAAEPTRLAVAPAAAPAAAPRSLPAGKSAFVLSVVSGSGGSGKSAASAIIAFQAAAQGYKTLLVDCDMQFGDMRLLSGDAPCLEMAQALASPEALAQAPVEAGRPCVVAAPPHVEQAESLGAQLPALLEAASRSFDLVVANTGASWDEPHLQLLERSSAVLFLVDQRVSSVRAAQRALDLCSRCGIATGQLVFAVNRCQRGALFTSIDVSCALDGAPVVELRDGGSLVEELLGAGMAQELVAMRNPFCESVEELLDRVLPNPDGTASARSACGIAPGATGALREASPRGGRRRRHGRKDGGLRRFAKGAGAAAGSRQGACA